MTEPDAPPEVVIRPNGKPYKARGVRARAWESESMHFDGYEGNCGVVVLGTHNLERAQKFANELMPYWYEHGLIAVSPEVDWFRLGYGQRNYPAWVRDAERGAAGVMFTAAWDPAVQQ
jgi:hypothetical protein